MQQKEEIINILLNNEHGSLENDGTVSKAGMIFRNQYPDIADKISSHYRSQPPASEEYKLETGDGYGTTYAASQPPHGTASGGYSPEQYWVKFTEMGDDYPNEKVVEMVTMPSGDIVVRIESGESLWFDKDGNHPKSKLIKITK